RDLTHNAAVRIRLWIVGNPQPRVGRDDLSWIEARIFLQQTSQRAEQQAGAHHQDDGEGQFRDDEYVPQATGPGTGAGPATTFANGRRESPSRRVERWHEAKHDAGENGNQQGEGQYHEVDADLVESGDVRRHKLQDKTQRTHSGG